MAHTFDIRFARSVGLANFFEAPDNSFRWKGGGLLSIDSQGISFSLRPGAASLLADRRSHRISADSIKEVYREGEALRVEFATDENSRTVLPFWARDRETAAQIVRLLPTTRTFEVEDSPAESPDKPASMQLLLLLALVATTAGGAWYFVREPALPLADAQAALPASPTGQQDAKIDAMAPVPVVAEIPAPVAAPDESAATPAASSPARPEYTAPMPEASADTGAATAPVTRIAPTKAATRSPPPAATGGEESEGFVPSVPAIRVRPEDSVIPIRQGTLAYDAGRGLLAGFEKSASELAEGYRSQRELADAGRLSQEDLANRLDSYAAQWRNMSVKLLDSSDAKDPALTGLRATLLAVASYQDRFLTGYASAARSRDADSALTALEDLAHADEMLERARLYVR